MLRNPELRRALLVGGLLTLLASAAAMSLSGWQAACHGTVDGIDVAAGSRDLGLHAQIARNTPGAEVAHGVGIGGTGARAHLARDGQLAGVVEHGRAVLGIDRGGGRLDIGRFRRNYVPCLRFEKALDIDDCRLGGFLQQGD